jgi:hypothetical protein
MNAEEIAKKANAKAAQSVKPMSNDQYLLQVMTDRCRILEDKLLAMVQRISELEMEKGGLKDANDNSTD